MVAITSFGLDILIDILSSQPYLRRRLYQFFNLSLKNRFFVQDY